MESLQHLINKFWGLILTGIGYAKGYWDRGKTEKEIDLQAEVEALKRLRNVKSTADRDAAIARLRKTGNFRED